MAEPVSLDYAKQHLRIGARSTAEDELVVGMIADAREWVESYTGQILIRREAVEWIDRFSDRLRTWPIISVDAVEYLDRAGLEQPLSDLWYRAAFDRRPARLALLSGCWPVTIGGRSAVKVTMQAGYEPDAVPRGAIRAMLLLITGYYENRDTGGLAAEVEAGAKAACRQMRARRV